MNKTNPKTNKKEYLSPEEECRYIAIVQGKTNASEQEIEDAWNMLYRSLIHYLEKLASEYAAPFTNNVVDYDDFLSEAKNGFLTAVKNFDPSRGCRLSTFADSWAKQAMQRGSERFAHSGSASSGDRAKFRKGRRLHKEGCSNAEISERCGFKWDEYEGMSFYRSMQDTIYADDGSTIEFGDGIADPNAVTAEQIEAKIDQEETLRKVYALLRTMDPKDVLLTVSDCGYFEKDPTLAELCGIAGLETPSGVKKKRDRIRAELRSSVYRSYNNLPLAG